MNRILFFILVLSTIFLFGKNLELNQSSNIIDQKSKCQNITDNTTVKFKVKGLRCSNDIGIIKKTLNELNGVIDYKNENVKHATSFIVIYNKKEVSIEEIYSTIESLRSCCSKDNFIVIKE